MYDAAMRLWAETSLVEVARWLEPSLKTLPAKQFEQFPATLVVPTMESDLLLKAGPDRLLHVEFETSPDDTLIRRMFEYRGRIMRLHEGFRLTQYVVVLGSGNVVGYDNQEKYGFTMDVRAIYLRDADPAEFLTSVLLAPFAVLARGSRKTREQSLAAAVRLLRDSRDPRARRQLQVLDALAGLVLERPVVLRIEKENGMNIEPLVQWYKTTEVGQRMMEIARDEGLEQGREQGFERTLLAMLRNRFGNRLEVTVAARQLTSWDEDAAVDAILTAPDLQQLLTATAPTGLDLPSGSERIDTRA